MKSENRYTRRDFVKGVALTGGSALLPGMALAQTVSTITRLNKQPASQPGGGSVYAWSIPVDRQIDFLILYSSTEASEPRTLAEVIAQWKNGTAKGIYFFERAEARTIEDLPAARLNSLLDRVDGLIAAYREGLESDRLFLAGQGGNERLYFGNNIILEQFPTLDELEFRVENEQLKITRAGGFRLRFRAPAESRYAQLSVSELTLDLRAPAPFRSGGFRIDLTKENFGAVASKLLRLAIYTTTPNPRGYVLNHQTCRFLDPLKPSLREDQQKACELVLDLREVQGPWVGPPPHAATRRLANSRVENFVAGLHLDTAYRTVSGNPVVLSPQRAGAQGDPARFLLVEDRDFLAADFEPTSAERATILFTPIGTFQFATNRIDDPTFGMVIGRHATDRLKCQVGDFLVFEAGHPSIYVDPQQQKPALNDEENSGIPEVLHGAQGGVVHSSWAKYAAAGNRPQNEQSKIGYFFCESKDDPPMGKANQVDKVLEEKGVTIDLERMDLAVGQVSQVIPMLPWGGTDAELEGEELAKFESFDATHLAPARQIRVRDAAKNRPQVANAGSKYGVTPQGLLAEIDDADFGANFKTIYFGSAKTGEVEIVLNKIHPLEADAAGDKKNRQKLQEALRASQSFLVAYTKEGLGRFSLRVRVDVFTFDIQLDQPLPEGACVIVKLRSDLSLRELLGDTSRWSCPEALNKEQLGQSAKENERDEILKHLEEGA